MNPGLLTAIDPTTTALSIGTGIVIFSEETQRLFCIRLNTNAAQAAGIGAIAMRAIDTGDHAEALEFIASLANDLASNCQAMANLTGQINTSKAA